MTPDETADLLAMFSANWPYFQPDENTVALWSQACAGLDFENARVAAYRYIELEDRPPVVASFRAEYDHCLRARRGAGPPQLNEHGACICDHGRKPGKPVTKEYLQPDGSMRTVEEPTVRPCETCLPEQFAWWQGWAADKRAEEARRDASRSPDRTFEANPQEGLTRVRDALASAKAWKRL